MKLSKWITLFISTVVIVGVLVSGFNYVVDPFGVFGDKFLKWDSYNMVNNPRVAKTAYLDEHHEEYDSYIIGGSKSSSIAPELLNDYYGDANFYSMMMYGGDFYDYEQTLYHLIDSYEVKNIIIHMSLHEIGHFNEQDRDFKQSLHAKVTDDALIPFYMKYLLLNPNYSYEKLEGYGKRLSDPTEYSQIIPENGVYNKVKRDAEEIDDLEQFIEDNPDFDLPVAHVEATAMDENAASLKRMKDYSEANGVNFTFMTGATYASELKTYDLENLKEYWRKLAAVTDFWDFTGYTSISNNPRYFYDSMHYRNNVGEMILGYMFDDPDVYVPKDFGHYTSTANVEEHIDKVFKEPSISPTGEEATVPILMYHHIDEDPSKQNSMIVSPEKFKQDMLEIKQAGYETVHLDELVDYVYGKGDLPENPVVVTFDDGYLSNYTYAYPVLKELDMKATISVIGWSVGRSTHRETGEKFYPHFNWDKAREMDDSGLIRIMSHSYDLHEGLDAERYAATMKEDESTGAYAEAFINDTLRLETEIEEKVGSKVTTYTYPYGAYTLLTEQFLADLDYDITVTTKKGVNTIKQGDPTSLFGLKRINAETEISSTDLVKKFK